MDLESLKARGVNPHIMVDTCDFMDYCINKHGYDNRSFHDDVWPKMSDFDGPYTMFSRTKNPKNVFEELLNAFLDDFPEFEDSVKMIFTN